VDDAGRVDHGSDGKTGAQSARNAERDEPVAGRRAVRDGESDERGRTEPARDPLLDRHRAGKSQPVSVQAMLLALSLTEPAASYAAEGSNPEWMPQCSQRGSFPGPYSSHSIPSSK